MRPPKIKLCFSLFAFYLLGLNLLSLHHSLEHLNAFEEAPFFSYNSKKAVFQADHDNHYVSCNLCDFFQSQVFFFLGEQILDLLSGQFGLPSKIFLEFTPTKIFVRFLRGPPTLF